MFPEKDRAKTWALSSDKQICCIILFLRGKLKPMVNIFKKIIMFESYGHSDGEINRIFMTITTFALKETSVFLFVWIVSIYPKYIVCNIGGLLLETCSNKHIPSKYSTSQAAGFLERAKSQIWPEFSFTFFLMNKLKSKECADVTVFRCQKIYICCAVISPEMSM